MDGSIIIRNAAVVSGASTAVADVACRDGRIVRIGDCGALSAARVLDCSGLVLMPGVLDAHVHFRQPGMEWKEDIASGSRAAAAGGVTGFFEMPNTLPPTTTVAALEEKRRIAAANSVVNYAFYIGADGTNTDEIRAAGNVCAVKVYMGSSTGTLLLDRQDMLEGLFRDTGRLIAVHAEDEEIIRERRDMPGLSGDYADHSLIRSPAAALKAVERSVALARKYGRRLHILHVSTFEEMEFLAQAKIPGRISVEACPHHLLLSGPDVYEKLGSLALVNPPLRGAEDACALWDGLKSGLVDCIATDHAPHTLEEKRKPYGQAPSGMPGVETALPLLLNEVSRGRATLPEVARWMSAAPARIFGARGKGVIEVGADADFVLVDMKLRRRVSNADIVSRAGWSPFAGAELCGWPRMTVVGGNLVFRDGTFLDCGPGREIIMEESG